MILDSLWRPLCLYHITQLTGNAKCCTLPWSHHFSCALQLVHRSMTALCRLSRGHVTIATGTTAEGSHCRCLPLSGLPEPHSSSSTLPPEGPLPPATDRGEGMSLNRTGANYLQLCVTTAVGCSVFMFSWCGTAVLGVLLFVSKLSPLVLDPRHVCCCFYRNHLLFSGAKLRKVGEDDKK